MSDESPVSRRTALKALGAVGVLGAVGSVPSLADTTSTSSPDTGATVAWERRYRKTLDDELFVDGAQHVVELDDGYVLGGGARPYRGPGLGSVWLARTDEAGERQWERTYPAESNAESGLDYRSMTRTADGGYAVAAMRPGDDDRLHGYGLKVGADGDPLWQVDLGPGQTSAVAAVDDGTVFAGLRYGESDESDPYPLSVTKRGSDGSEAWTWTGRVDPADESETDVAPKHRASVAIPTDDGGVLVAGVTDYYRAGAVEGLLKFSAGGELEWRSVRGDAGIDARYEGETADLDGLLALDDGGYAVLGDSGSYDDGDVVVSRVTEEGEVTAAATLEGPTDGADEASGFVRSGSGYTIAANVDGDPDRAQVIRTTDGTSVEWATLLEDPEFDLYATDLVASEDGAVVVGSFGAPKQDNGALLLKLVESSDDADGETEEENDGGSTTTEEPPTTTEAPDEDDPTDGGEGTTTGDEETPAEEEPPATTEPPEDSEESTDDGRETTAPGDEPTTTDTVDEDGDGCAKND